MVKIRECAAHGDRQAALRTLREAIIHEKIAARDGVELMLAVRQGSPEIIAEAVDVVQSSSPGAYRFVPRADYAFA